MSNAQQSGAATDTKLAANAGRLNDELHGRLVDMADKFHVTQSGLDDLVKDMWAAGKRLDNFDEAKDPVFVNEVRNAATHWFEGRMSDVGLTKAEILQLEGGKYNVGYVVKTDKRNLPEMFTEKRESLGGNNIRRYHQQQANKFWDAIYKRFETRTKQFAAASDPTGQVSLNATKTLTCKDLVKIIRRHNKDIDNPILKNNEYAYLVKMLNRIGKECKYDIPDDCQ